jgi:holo-[acyl-carrier protein] synthase
LPSGDRSLTAAFSLMILSIGIDIAEVYRIRETIARTPRFAERVFTAREREYCESRGAAAAQSYAGRFAAKEAFLKALKTGWRGKITWTDIEILNDADGVPAFAVTGEAKRLLNETGAAAVHLSISHTAEHAVAQVIFEK